MRIDIFSLFPGMFTGPLTESIVKRAVADGLVEIAVHDIRNWTTDRHRTADDAPYGGGAGMVMKAPPIVEAVEAVLGNELDAARVILLSAGGKRFDQLMAQNLATSPRIVMICGHYEGVDQRVVDILRAEEISIGDFVLTGGELPAMVIADAVIRLIPGVIDAASIADESHAVSGESLVEYPQYTRPLDYRGHSVPDVLLSGHHANIAAWRRSISRERTKLLRPDLLAEMDVN